MGLNTTSLAPTVAREPTQCLTTSWQFIRSHDNVLLYLSLVLLLLSSVDSGPLGGIVKLLWLASVASLTFINIGAALTAYIGSLAIYSPLHFDGWTSPFERPDNYALVIIFAGMLLVVHSKEDARPRFNAYVLAFMTFCVLHAMIFSSRIQFVALLRDILIPLSACELLAAIKLRERELDALQNGMAVLGSYIGLISLLERIPATDWILPPWIGNPSLRPFDLSLEGWIGAGRSGGTLLQPAWNGLLLSLIFYILLLRMRRGGSWPVMMAMSLCVAGSFFTYTRGVWLGLLLALMWFPGWCSSLQQKYVRRAALVCIAAVLIVVAGGMARDRLQDNGTIYYRFNLWGAGLRLTMAHPLLGVGFFNFAPAMTDVEQGFGSLLPSLPTIEGDASHNTLLTVLVEFGIVGFFLYAAALFKIVQRAMNNGHHLWGRSGAGWVLAFAFIYLVNAQFVSAFEGTTNFLFFGFLGIMAGALT
jgi:O-antigen ligase